MELSDSPIRCYPCAFSDCIATRSVLIRMLRMQGPWICAVERRSLVVEGKASGDELGVSAFIEGRLKHMLKALFCAASNGGSGARLTAVSLW